MTFETSKNVLSEKDLLEKGATLKRFEYSIWDKELKAQIDILNKQYQTIKHFYSSDEKEEPTLKIIVNQI